MVFENIPATQAARTHPILSRASRRLSFARTPRQSLNVRFFPVSECDPNLLGAGAHAPQALREPIREARSLQAGRQKFVVARRGAFRFVQVLARHPVEYLLSAREREIVQRYARGETHAAIATSLALSPATVRNHLAHC